MSNLKKSVYAKILEKALRWKAASSAAARTVFLPEKTPGHRPRGSSRAPSQAIELRVRSKESYKRRKKRTFI